MNERTTAHTSKSARLLLLAVAVLCVGGAALARLKGPLASGEDKPGVLILTVVDESTGKPMPARVELLDDNNKPFVADDALQVGGD